ncbi:NAD(P)/FAD-dependent oxidoreductase [Glaciibacter sp. 2TAF33]|uniref:NAD(P)/FAD-dependent oxidoreductase n=1 Tax=Glaciibacter sp. 2TAF33 TaxID=3233015 RepID=UPI003F8ED9ED
MTGNTLATSFSNGSVSYWVASEGRPPARSPLPGDIEADVAIVGGGLTGLWTAYYLAEAEPELEIAIIEKEFAGFGASGRNGGWMSAKPAGMSRQYAKREGTEGVIALQHEMFAAVDESVRVARAEGFGQDVVQDGLLHVATNRAQLSRMRTSLAALRDTGWDGDHLLELTPAEFADRIRVEGALGGYWTRHCARVHPAKYVFGLAAAVERRGVTIYENTAAISIAPHTVRTNRGTVRAKHIVQALEGYTGSLQGQRRRLLPMNSSMVITEPLTTDEQASIGWEGAELLGDVAHSFAYLQRTADGRIALGGRGVPYNFSSSFDPDGRTAEKALKQLGERLRELFPGLSQTRLQHSWSGVLGVPRDWSAAVTFDAASGIAVAGGYVGHGLTGTNLAARTVRDLLLGEQTTLTRLPWVGHRSQNWELEPIRWIGAASLYAAYRFADRREYRSGSASTHPAARFADLLSGRAG